jgi:predicted dehydrogenase
VWILGYKASDIDREKIEKLKISHPEVKITTDYREILSDPNVDAVVIATPTYLHHKLIKESLLAEKHVLVEKPMTSNIIEAREVIQIAKDKNKILMVDHTFEYSPAINKIKDIINSNELGDIYSIKADWLNLGLLQPDINVIWDLAPHIISIINYLINKKVITVSANAIGYLRKDIAEIAQINIDFENNQSAYITVSWLDPTKTRKFTIIGSKKFLVFDLMAEDGQIKVYDKGAEIISNRFNPNDEFIVKYRRGDIYSPSIENKEPLQEVCSHFADCILNNKIPRSDGGCALKTLEVLEAANNSLKINGNKIPI